jgi:Spy/CpxP family protein refolding chaperone
MFSLMTKRSLRACAWKSSLLVVACCALAHGQAASPKPGVPVRAEAPVNRAPHQAPCWQQVGISKAAIDQRRSVEQNTRAQVEAVCADPSLTPQQKHAKIKDIRQQARAQIDSIISPPQQQELKACNAERNPGRIAAGGPKPPGPALGPCGETLPAAPSAPKKDTPSSEQP